MSDPIVTLCKHCSREASTVDGVVTHLAEDDADHWAELDYTRVVAGTLTREEFPGLFAALDQWPADNRPFTLPDLRP